MPITFQGGQSMPAQGTEAYKALSSAQQSGTSGAGSFNPTTGALSVSNGISATPIYVPPASGGMTSSKPVITANDAKADYLAKMSSFNTLSKQIAEQGIQKASQEQLAQQKVAQEQLQASENNLKQQGIDIQKTQAMAQQQQAQAKLEAAKALGAPEITPTQSSSQSTTTPQQTTASITPIDNNSPQNTSQKLNSNLITEQSALNNIQSQKDTVASQSVSLLQQVMSGTIPLTGTQQSLIASLQTQLQQNKVLQTQANDAFTGSVTQAAFRSGGEYTPAQMAGQIQNAVSVGVARIQQLDNSAAKTMAELEQSFQQKNYEVINKQYDILTKQLDDKSKAIKDTYDQTTKLIQDQRDFEQKSKQDQIVNDLNSSKFSWQQKQDIIDNAIKSGQLSVAQGKLALDQAKQLADPNSPAAKKEESKNSLLSTKGLIDSILANPYLTNVMGLKTPGAITIPFSGGKTIGELYGSSTVEVNNQIKQLVAALSLENRQKLKGSGAISDFEAKTLERAASAFSTGLSDDAGIRQLHQIRGALTTAAGLETDVMVKDPSTGEYQILKTGRDGINKAISDGLLVIYQ